MGCSVCVMVSRLFTVPAIDWDCPSITASIFRLARIIVDEEA